MIKVPLLFFIFISAHAFAQADRMGGQNGSGGNGCYLTTESGRTWRSLEEVSLSTPVYREQTVTFGEGYDSNRLPRRRKNHVHITDMTRFKSFSWARSQVLKLSRSAPLLTRTILNFFAFFGNVHVIQYKMKGIYHGDISNTDKKCERYQPVFLTRKDGAVIVSRPIWNDMDSTSKEFIFIHEVLRFLQMFHPSFKNFSDHDLQDLTKIIILEEYNLKTNEKISLLEETLKDPALFYSAYESGSKAQVIFSERLAFCEDQLIDLKACLAGMYQNQEYLELIKQSL